MFLYGAQPEGRKLDFRLSMLKGTEVLTSSDLSFKEGSVRLLMLPFNPISDQKFGIYNARKNKKFSKKI